MKNNLFAKTNLGLSSFIALHFLFLFFQSSHLNENNFTSKSYIIHNTDRNTKIKFGVFELEDDDIKWIDSTINAMPLFEKCAQIFMPAVFGRNLDTSSSEFRNTLELVRDYGIGGVVISSGGIDETALMINELQKNAKIPLLVSADFENGVGMRIIDANTFPHNMAIGSTNNSDYANETGKAIAIEASLLGVNINFAPVADINNNSENPVINLRSFSEDKNIVKDFCSAFVNGSKDGGIIATAKHFPGHGNTKIDSHKDLPIISGSKEYLYENELSPFIQLIDDGVQAIMIGHLSVPAFESKEKLPSSLSYNIITKLLKEELGFKGLIITDALDMKAVTNYYSDSEAVLNAFTAGNDILLMPPDIKSGIRALYDAVKSGRISEERLNESVRKILAAKRWLKLESKKITNLESLSERIKIKKHQDLAKEIAEKSVTIVKMDETIFPINPKSFSKVFVINLTNRKNSGEDFFSSLIKEKFSVIDNVSLNSRSEISEYKSAFNSATNSDLIIIALYYSLRVNGNGNDKLISDSQVDLIKKYLKLNKKVIMISFENPYLLSFFPEAEDYICTFSDTKVSQQAALDLLIGSIQPNGKLPVSIPNTEFKIGYKWEPNN